MEVGSFLKGSTSITGLSRSIQSAEEFESHFELPNSNEISFGEKSYFEIELLMNMLQFPIRIYSFEKITRAMPSSSLVFQ